MAAEVLKSFKKLKLVLSWTFFLDVGGPSLFSKGTFNNYVDKMRGEGVKKMSVFVHAQGIKTVH